MDTRAEWDSLAGIYFPVMLAVTGLVIAAFLYPVLRYRRRREAPSQHSEAPRIELVVGAALLSIAAVLAAPFAVERSAVRRARCRDDSRVPAGGRDA
jgi:heme/copper-type cytochrome/quinol oxidase subunit 2